MTVIANRRSVMTLFSKPADPWSHRTRLVLSEKSISIDIVDVDDGSLPEDLLDLNPYNSVPTLVDRDLVLYDSRVIMEYLDERFPHPPLMPVDPVTRAQFRLALFRIERDWYSLADEIGTGAERKPMGRAVKALEESILSSVEIFSAKKFFLSDEFSLVDCTIAPILWRLPLLGIKLPPQARPIQRYLDEVFSRRLCCWCFTEFSRRYTSRRSSRHRGIIGSCATRDDRQRPHSASDRRSGRFSELRPSVKDNKIVLNVSYAAARGLTPR
jgi:RNA polymerase-associated protein